jgi:hypothetical protein
MSRSVRSILAFGFAVALVAHAESNGQPPKKIDPKKDDRKKKVFEPKPAPPPPPPPILPPPVTPVEPDRPRPDTTRPASPIDLARGLREHDQPDLALEYLATLDEKPLPPDVRAEVSLEIALARLAAGAGEADDAKRDAFVARAVAAFERFLLDHPDHARVPDAAVAKARATSWRARNALHRALRQPAAGDRDKAAASATRPLFRESARQFDDAAAKLAAALAGPELSENRRLILGDERGRAQLDRGITLYELSRTYVRPTGAEEITARGEALRDANRAFDAVGDRDHNNPYAWVARAWRAECLYGTQDVTEADRLVAEIRTEATKYPAARGGIRTLRYFEVARKYQAARSPSELSAARGLAERWLVDFPAARPTREHVAVRYYVAFLRKEEAILTGVRTKGDGDAVTIESVSENAKRQLRVAEREYRSLLDSGSDYADRAARDRTQLLRYLVGNAPKPPAAYATFDEAHMAALVLMGDAGRGEKDPAKVLATAATYLERALAVAGPTDAPRDLAEARVQLAYAYLHGGTPAKAAALAEPLARSSRSAALATRAGTIAAQSYLSLTPPDPAKALAVAAELETKYPAEPGTDALRVLLGGQFYRDERYAEAFQTLARVTPEFPNLANARLTEGAAAYQLLRGDTTLSAPLTKAFVREKALADLRAVPSPGPGTSAADARAFLLCRQQAIEITLLDPDRAPAALQDAARLAAAIGEFRTLPDEIRLTHSFDAERLRLTALAGSVVPLAKANKWREVNETLGPVVRTLVNSIPSDGPATKRANATKASPGADPTYAPELTAAAERLDRVRRDTIVVLALQGAIRVGETGRVKELMGVLEALGGGPDAPANALGQLLSAVVPQSNAMRRNGKADDADRLTASVAELVVAFATTPNLPARHTYFAGKALNDLGRPTQAIPLLATLPDAAEADLRAAFATLSDEKKAAVRTHRSAKLELAKAHRLAGEFDKAAAILKAATGDDKTPGWAARLLDYRKEAIRLTEARAAAETDAKKMNELWATANRDWGKLGREYYAVLVRPLPADPEQKNELTRTKNLVKPIYFGIIADNQRCLVKANAMILKDKPEALDKKYDGVANTLVTLERQNPDLAPDVRDQFADLLNETPALKAKYAAGGGTLFLRDQ